MYNQISSGIKEIEREQKRYMRSVILENLQINFFSSLNVFFFFFFCVYYSMFGTIENFSNKKHFPWSTENCLHS